MASSPTQEGLLGGSQSNRSLKPTSKQRRLLLIQAYIWRWLARVGFYLHKLPKPSPPSPSFRRSFSTSFIQRTGSADLELAFYVPKAFHEETRAGKRFPIVLSLHGGGFTMGTTTDDARWADMVVNQLDVVVVSAQYRLAPEHPFPTAVDDGVAVVIWLGTNSSELGLDAQRMALTGFSAGGNLAFTIPLRLHEYLSSTSDHDRAHEPVLPTFQALVSWYPSIDYRLSRVERRATCVRPEKTLPPTLTTLFDKSYLPDPDDAYSPYVSPAAADDGTLRKVLPPKIALYLCEWDMLQREGAEFAERLIDLGKDVQCVTIKERRHAFDKAPWPFGVDPKITQYYKEACDFLKAFL